jgi:hypothetical protein
VTQLPQTLGGNGTAIGTFGMLDLNDAGLDRTPCGTGYTFTGKGDAHGLSLYTGIDNGQRGLVVDLKNVCAAIVDLAGLVGAPRMVAEPNRVDTACAAWSGSSS